MIWLLPASAIVMGLTITLLIWGLRGWLSRRFERDQMWMRETFLRFSPQPINAKSYTISYYVGFTVLLLLLEAVIPNAIVAFGFWLLSLVVPRVLIDWAWTRRLKQVDAQIAQSVSTLANSIRAGLTLVQGITRLSEQAPEPIRTEFKIMANQYAYGADLETVIRNMKTRLSLPNFTLFATALILNREMGGNIADTLTRISKSLDKMREMKKTVEAHTSEGRTNIKVLLMAPVFMLLLMALVDFHGVMLLFTTTQGIAVLTVAATLSGTGVYFAGRITQSDV